MTLPPTWVDVPSGRVACWSQGSGDPTVVLHAGMCDTAEIWEPLVTQLAPAHRVITFDHRYAGQTRLSAAPPSTRQLAADLEALTAALGVERFHLVGTSMGGMAAQWFAIDYPERLASLVLASTLPAPTGYSRLLWGHCEDLARRLDVATALRDAMCLALSPTFLIEHEQTAAAMFAECGAGISAESFFVQLAAIQAHDARSELPKVGAPTLVLVGRADRSIPPEESRPLLRLIENAAWAEVAGGHYPWLEDPVGCGAAITSFLARSPAEARA